MILAVVLGAAGLGLTFDRVILGSDVTSPTESTAGVLDLQPDTASLLIEPSTATAPTGEPIPTLADRLRLATADHVAESTAERDAFSPSAQWFGSIPGSGQTVSAPLNQAHEAFKRQNHLEAVLVTGNQRCAVVNGQTIYIGQELQGYRLVAVHERSVEFESKGVRVLLGIRNGASAS